MGFFTTSSGYNPTDIEDLLNDDTLNVYEGMGLMEAAYTSIAETEMNWNSIMEAAAMTELEYFATTGEEYTYTNEAGFFEGIVNFFKKIWEKIKSLFKKFMVMLGSLVMKDKDFSKKYAKTIRENIKNIPSGAEIKGYKFTYEKLEAVVILGGNILDAFLKVGALANAVDKTSFAGFSVENLNNENYDSTDTLEKLRGFLMSPFKGATASMTDGELREIAFSACRNDEDSPDDIKIDGGVVNQALADLEGGDKAKRAASKLYKNTEKIFKTAMKDAENIEKNFYKEKPEKGKEDVTAKASVVVSRLLSLAKSTSNMLQTMSAVYLQAVKDKYSQDRKICVKVVTYKNVKEGATVSHTSEGGYFAGINLI